MDGMNCRVFYAESEFKAVSRVGNAVLRALSPDYATASRCIHLVASFSPTLSRMLGRPSLKTSLRQEYRKEILTISLHLPKPDTVEVEVHLGEHSIDVTWKTLESSPVDDWLSKLTISLPFQPRAVAKNVDDTDGIFLTITQQLCCFSDNLSSINDKVFNNTYKAVIKSGDIDGMNRPVFYREPRLKTGKKMASSLVKAFSIEISLASTLAHTVASQSSFLSQLIGRPSLQTSLRQEFKHNVLTLWLQLFELNTKEIEVGIGEHAITVTWKKLEPSPEDEDDYSL